MASSCSHWWHAPVYVTMSVVLAMVAITTSSHSNHKPQTPLSLKPDLLITNASRSLRQSGFNFMATLLQISPELLLPPSEATFFAIPDTAISNISLPPWLMKDLLHYHTSPSKLSLTDLLQKPQGSCIPTLLDGKNISITKINTEKRSIEINGVLVSHPDIFNQGPYSIHGVNAPFSSIDPLREQQDWNFNGSPNCGANSKNTTESRNRTLWNRILRLLSSNGYTSFAIGLHSVLDGILQEYGDLNSVTIFAPSDFFYITSPSPELEKIVKFHIIPERFGYKELLSLPGKSHLRTLDGGNVLGITEVHNVTKGLGINGVEITAPDVLSSEDFVVHGISQPFEMAKLSTLMS